jgi:hypothetical protein
VEVVAEVGEVVQNLEWEEGPSFLEGNSRPVEQEEDQRKVFVVEERSSSY